MGTTLPLILKNVETILRAFASDKRDNLALNAFLLSLGYLTGLASRLLSNILAMRFQEADIDMTAEQWGAILVLMNGEAMIQGQLRERLYLGKSSVSRLTDGLERRGWIVRTKDPKDSRQKLVTPTPKVIDSK